MFWSLVRPDRILLPITRSAAVTTSLEAGELAVVMITCGGRNRGRMTHDGQRCERILRRLLPPCHCGLCCFMADPKRKPRQGDVDRDTGERRRQEEALDEALKNTFQHPIRFQSSSRRRAGAPIVPDPFHGGWRGRCLYEPRRLHVLARSAPCRYFRGCG